MYENNITVADMEAFVSKASGRASKVFSVLGKSSPFMEAWSDPIGQQLLQDGFMCMDEIVEKIVNQKATDEEIAEYRAMKKILTRWADRVKTYLDNHKRVLEGGNGGANGKARKV